MCAKFILTNSDITNRYANLLDFDAYVQQMVSDAIPAVCFYRGDEPATAADVYQYLLEEQRDACEGQMECSPALRHQEPDGQWRPLTDAPLEVEKGYVMNVASLWLAFAFCDICREAALAASAQMLRQYAPV